MCSRQCDESIKFNTVLVSLKLVHLFRLELPTRFIGYFLPGVVLLVLGEPGTDAKRFVLLGF